MRVKVKLVLEDKLKIWSFESENNINELTLPSVLEYKKKFVVRQKASSQFVFELVSHDPTSPPPPPLSLSHSPF